MTKPIISTPPHLLAGAALDPAGLSSQREPVGAPPAPTEEEADDAPDALECRQWEAEIGEHGQRIDRVLAARLPALSRAWLQNLIGQGALRLNASVCQKPAHKLRVGDRIEIELRPTAQASAFVPEPMALQPLYEDAHLLVLDKPVGLVVHPAAGHWGGTLLNGLLAHHAGATMLPRAGIVHRLDKDTSGLMVVAKTQACFDALVRQIALRQVHRVYLALVHGAWRHGPEHAIEQPIGRDPRQRLRMAVLGPEHSGAKPALTHVRPLAVGSQSSLLGCKLHTGRTHQIRVHLAWSGHTLVADPLYGGPPALGLQRQALHAHQLALRHPHSGQWMHWHCPAPPDLMQALEAAGLHYNPKPLWALDTEPVATDDD